MDVLLVPLLLDFALSSHGARRGVVVVADQVACTIGKLLEDAGLSSSLLLSYKKENEND